MGGRIFSFETCQIAGPLLYIEAKISESKKRMEYWCDVAVGQIIRNGYANGIDGYREVLCCGISFYKKDAMVKKME